MSCLCHLHLVSNGGSAAAGEEDVTSDPELPGPRRLHRSEGTERDVDARIVGLEESCCNDSRWFF